MAKIVKNEIQKVKGDESNPNGQMKGGGYWIGFWKFFQVLNTSVNIKVFASNLIQMLMAPKTFMRL